MNNLLSIDTIRFFVLVLVQVLICSNINFLGYINPQIYILFILLFPVKNNRAIFLCISFLIGLCIDIFLDSGGIHAAACVLIAYLRPVILKFSFGMAYEYQTMKFNTVEFGSKLTYITIFTTIHHFTVFYLEIFSISKIVLVLQKTLFSSIFTILLIVLITILFKKKK